FRCFWHLKADQCPNFGEKSAIQCEIHTPSAPGAPSEGEHHASHLRRHRRSLRHRRSHSQTTQRRRTHHRCRGPSSNRTRRRPLQTRRTRSNARRRRRKNRRQNRRHRRRGRGLHTLATGHFRQLLRNDRNPRVTAPLPRRIRRTARRSSIVHGFIPTI